MVTHTVKTHARFWDLPGKNFDLRNGDRGYLAGDYLEELEFEPVSQQYTGRSRRRMIQYVLAGEPQFGLKDGYVILGMAESEEHSAALRVLADELARVTRLADDRLKGNEAMRDRMLAAEARLADREAEIQAAFA